MDKKKIIFLAIVICIICAFLFFKVLTKKTTEISNNVDTTLSATSTVLSNDNYTIESVPIEENSLPSVKIPDLKRTVKMSQSLSKEAVDILNRNISTLQSTLSDNPKQFDYWVSLGNNYKVAGDLEGAREVWEYASLYQPSQPVPHLNLADLYAYYLKDNKKAEEHFKKALVVIPKEASVYLRMSDFYKDVLKDLNKSKSILEKGLIAIPDEASLKQALENIKTLIAEKVATPKPL
jgi:tetratricopeptide (TPR) repeat protein